MADKKSTPTAEETAPAQSPAPASAPDNPYWPDVLEAPHTHITIRSTLFPLEMLRIRRPKRRDEPHIRKHIRESIAAEGLTVEDLDVYSYNIFYLGALFASPCVEVPEAGLAQWLDMSFETVEMQDAWAKIEEEVFEWWTNFRNYVPGGGKAGGVEETRPADSGDGTGVRDGLPDALQPPAA